MKRGDLKYWAFAILLCVAQYCCGQNDTTGVTQKIKDAGIKHHDIVFAQLCLESGYLKCENCSWSCCNNPFGFFWKGKYLVFKDIDEAISYYKWWQDQIYKGGDYYEFLQTVGYAEDPNYINKLKQIK